VKTPTQEGEKGSDILKKVFGTEPSTEKGTEGTTSDMTSKSSERQIGESSEQREGQQQASMSDVLSGFQSSSGSSGIEGQQQQQ